MEHGGIGRAFGRAGYGSDIRLACYGLDKNDNDFVVGLIGPELYPLSSSSSACARRSRPRNTWKAWARSLSARRCGRITVTVSSLPAKSERAGAAVKPRPLTTGSRSIL